MMNGLCIERMVEFGSRDLRRPCLTANRAGLRPGAIQSVTAILQYPIPLILLDWSGGFPLIDVPSISGHAPGANSLSSRFPRPVALTRLFGPGKCPFDPD